MNLECFFNPRSISLIGASHSERKLGGTILKNLLKFRGRVYPVNPKYNDLMGLKAYRRVEEIPEIVDLSIIIRPATEVPEILVAQRDMVRCAIIISAGFAEVGESKLQDEVKRLGQELGIRILGPNCMGIYNPYGKLDTLFLPYERLKRPKRGNIAVTSQSGAILSYLFGAIRAANVGISRAVHYGNAIDIDESDLYEYLMHDRDTDVVISYIESVGDGRKFIKNATVLSEKKPLIILKSGKGSRGEVAAYSHTGRLAGRYEVFSSILRQFGIKEALDLDDLTDKAKALSLLRSSKGNRVLIITNGGGSGVLAVDECMRQDLEVTPLPEEKKERLREIFPDFYVVNNPVDLTAQVRDEDYLVVLKELKDFYDGFIVIALANVLGITERLSEIIKNFKEDSQKPLIFHIDQSEISRKLIALLERSRIPVYPSPERAVRGLKALLS
ncbi:MAG: CoA-binding protein [Nitrospirota bacterium]